ncbi:hypothetical protein [Streptomyces sp. NBC_01800]|uniref:hypothetical protein n=1 Tax=Streptomyces sp. NBC_01800 TaxID=2975945 RepID=UPI002DD7BEE0|nr:hypothetical protein [Streptomyces sp. NBC_01800]WSA68791.1 hypothetical protein OIE65_18395 [Streptomyces sp. NBC_01800]
MTDITTSDLLDARANFRIDQLKQLLADREVYERRCRQEAQASYQRFVLHQAQADRFIFSNPVEGRQVRAQSREDFVRVFDPFPREREALEAREAALRDHWNELAVWTRTTPGAPLKIYHYTAHCHHVSGRGRHPDLFEAQFEPEAVARGLKACYYDLCAWAHEELDGLRKRRGL